MLSPEMMKMYGPNPQQQQSPTLMNVGPDEGRRKALIEMLAKGAPTPRTPLAGGIGVATSAINSALDEMKNRDQLKALQNLIGGWNTTVTPGA